jgi:predicted phage terminase large subunit-like protein
VDFGRKVRNIIDTEAYRQIFPTVNLAADSKSAGRWNTNVGGEYFACGVGSALAGRGADLLLVDDPHNEQDIINGNLEIFDRAYEWFTFGARTRLMPGGRVAIIQTRWHLDDLTGRVVRDMTQNSGADQYEVVEFPAILEVKNKKTGEISEKALWPEFFDMPALLRTKASMPVFQWNAQFQQNPTAEEAAVVKREWWNTWEKEDPPSCSYLIMSLDSAAETNNRADFTALTTWGVFLNKETDAHNIILLNAIKKRVEFPELKELCYREWKEWEPDAFIVEKKSSGTQLYQEIRRTGLPIQEFTPHRGTGDKMARLNSVADIIRSGLVWVPQTRWAEEVVEEVAGFPFVSNDDLVDSTVMALMRFRQGGFIRLPSDEQEETRYFKSRRGGYY